MFWLLEAKTTSRTQVIMSTFITIKTDKKNEKYIEDGFEIMKSVDMSLSSYNKDAKVFLLNKNLHVSLDAYLYEALSLCKYYYKVSYGYFDITVGSITKDLYRFGEDERVASASELKSAKIDFNALKFNEKEAFIEDGMKVDLGGMGKGFGVQKVADYLKKMQVDDAIISASGDIRCLSTCKIEVQNPFDEESRLLSFETLKSDMGISTSGNYNRYILSKENNHLIDPKAKKPQMLFASITLISSLSSASLDAYATAASVMPTNKAYEFLDTLDVAYIIVQSDKEIVISKNIASYVKNLSNFSK
ncbi:ApbE-like lipoprotein [Sulfurimonas denitrificans DSM 1251]|uniref:FAD:protein FMN transferase n=1 Tax=Sulfurimonas denitrificans (strain ATCC 33889 / DSM 1251) TaxID=326298 RepID=Q30RB5_SULDN|nr:FAD:protein FMN transferase [Sulfurimonas denitrificans]ABB44466.1 ApbE-like lipoprotein [Sulfurimonas denitrificans DSM 1251]MDD3441648.1 FAD:protein FMN transferase [Sulfurimonas denitrificans]